MDEFPYWEKWSPIIREDLKRYPFISDEMKEFILKYSISAITDAFIESQTNLGFYQSNVTQGHT